MDVPRSARVLVVDDVDAHREIYVMALQFAGFDATAADDGATAMVTIAHQRPEVILVDLSMPGIDGWELCRRLKSDPQTTGIKVIALTAHVVPGVRESAFRAGCDAFIAKPCAPAILVEEVRRQLRRETSVA